MMSASATATTQHDEPQYGITPGFDEGSELPGLDEPMGSQSPLQEANMCNGAALGPALQADK